MKPLFVFSEKYTADLQGHVFPIEKYKYLHERLTRELHITEFLEPQAPPQTDIALVHTEVYLHDLFGLHFTPRTMSSEMALTQEIVDLFVLSVGGTILASQKALAGHSVFHLGGGWHHAFADHAEGFCYLNDVAIAIRKLQQEDPRIKVSIVDGDLHQGNGNAHIFLNDDNVFTFSLHQHNLYPVKQESNLDIGLSDFADDKEYLAGLEKGVQQAVLDFKPQMVFYLAGADPFEHDQLGTLRTTFGGLKKRDEMVLTACKEIGAPVVITLAGGYATDTRDTVAVHFNTAKTLVEMSEEL